MKARKIGAIDIGTTKVCSFIAETDGTGLRILGLGVSSAYGLQKSQVININEARESVRKSIKAAEQTAGCRMDSAVITIGGNHVSSSNRRGVISITGNKKQTVRPADIKRVLGISRRENIGPDEVVLHQIPRYYRVDGQDGVKNPVGMHCYRLDVETHTVTASFTAVENLNKCMSGTGVSTDAIVFEPLSSAGAILQEDEKRDGVLMIDIGGGSSTIAVYKDNSIYYSSCVSVGGNQITRDISLGLGVSLEIAEELKLQYGSLVPGAFKDDDECQIEEGHTIPLKDLHDIINIRVEELIRLVVIQVQKEMGEKQEPPTLLPAGIVVTGGTANLPGICEMFQEITNMPCRIGRPPRLSGVADNISNPAFAASAGLLIWKLESLDNQYLPEISNNGFVKDGLLNRLFKFLARK